MNITKKSKNKLNSIYGMMAQNPVKQSIDFIDDWMTAWARYRLEEGIWLAGDNFVYCDTDSVNILETEV